MKYGPQTKTVEAFLRHLKRMTPQEWATARDAGDAAGAAAWDAAWAATGDAAGAAAWDAAWDAGDAAGAAAWDAAWDAARAAARDATRDATWATARDATRDAAGDAAWAATRDAAGDAAWAAARDAAWGAANEIQGAAFMREQGQPFFFLPMFGFADPEAVLAADQEPDAHGDNCWALGPQHYECALREIARQREVIETWREAHIDATGGDQ